MKLKHTNPSWYDYDIFFDGLRTTDVIEADTTNQYIRRPKRPDVRVYGNVNLVHKETGKMISS